MKLILRLASVKLLFACAFPLIANGAAFANTVILNALDAEGLEHSAMFINSCNDLTSDKKLWGLDIHIFSHKDVFDKSSSREQLKNHKVTFYTRTPLKNRNIGWSNPPDEQVSNIFESFEFVLSNVEERKVLILSFHKSTRSAPTTAFPSFFNRLRGGSDESPQQHDILLPSKTRKLTSVSDWHDLMVVGIAGSSSAKSWIKSFQEVYMRFADRNAFTLLDPRPAMLESSLRHRNDVSIGYLSQSDVCAMPVGAKHRCGPPEPYLKVICGEHAHSKSSCLIVDEPTGWKQQLDRGISKHIHGHFASKENLAANIMAAMWKGVVRFRNTSSSDTPRGYCWDTG